MVERNRSDDRGLWRRDHIGRVEASAESGLQQQPVGGRVGEQMERRRRGDLEEGDRPGAIRALAQFQRVLQRVIVDELAAAWRGEADALVEAQQMRRGVHVDAGGGGLQRGAQEGQRRALAVGSGDVNGRRQGQIGPAHRVQQPLYAPQRKVDLLGVKIEQSRQNRVVLIHAAPCSAQAATAG